jgi:hypothetical protein
VLNHAAGFRDLLDHLLEEEVSIEVDERALDHAAEVWSARR